MSCPYFHINVCDFLLNSYIFWLNFRFYMSCYEIFQLFVCFFMIFVKHLHVSLVNVCEFVYFFWRFYMFFHIFVFFCMYLLIICMLLEYFYGKLYTYNTFHMSSNILPVCLCFIFKSFCMHLWMILCFAWYSFNNFM